jgi:hypothetical protein
VYPGWYVHGGSKSLLAMKAPVTGYTGSIVMGVVR